MSKGLFSFILAESSSINYKLYLFLIEIVYIVEYLISNRYTHASVFIIFFHSLKFYSIKFLEV